MDYNKQLFQISEILTNTKLIDEEQRKLFFEVFSELIYFAKKYGFHGNLWHVYLTWILIYTENSYTKRAEIIKHIGESDSLDQLFLRDLDIFLFYFKLDLDVLCKQFDESIFRLVNDFSLQQTGKAEIRKSQAEIICILARKLGACDDTHEMKQLLDTFYEQYGVGKYALYQAFRLEEQDREVQIIPISYLDEVSLDDLVGYESQKKKLCDNTQAFIEGKKANNCLLFGDPGTGKSSSMKGVLQKYSPNGLRMIEVYKHQFRMLQPLMSQLKNRNYHFIIYMDDLSFEDFEIEYKYLKAMIEGGLESKPDNILIYATSNRRHLIREKFSDKEERRDDLHSSDTVSEKLSLSNRFGITIFFCAPERKEFQHIVKKLAKKHQISISEEELIEQANRWEMYHGGLSGRTAKQFVDYLAGQ